MTTTVSNNNENKVTVNRIGFSGSFSKFFKENTQVDDAFFEGGKHYSFTYSIKLDDNCKNGHLTFSFTGEIKVKKGNGRFYNYISGAISDIIAYFKPELEKFNRLHLCNHLGQPMYIDNIRYHINEGKSNQEISEMYNISDMGAVEILRNASDNKDLFYYLVFRLGVADTWGKLANEAIQEIESKSDTILKIEGKDRVYKQLPKEDCELLENLYQSGYASKVQKELRDKARKEAQKEKELREIEKEYEIKKAVISYGISWNNVMFYDHKNELCFNWSDGYKKIPSDVIDGLVCSNTLPEEIEVTNLNKGRE
jgi:hypothetical protein